MAIDIREETTASLAEYATIPMTFSVRSRLRVSWINGGLGGIHISEEAVDPPYLKDYDAVVPTPGETPLTWGRRWDMSNWGIFMARDDQQPAGGAVVAWRTRGVHMLEGRDDLAVLWGVRVRSDRRRQGIGRQLMGRAARWAEERHCGRLKIETQNNNVAACRFYAACGCRLCGIHPGAYAELPDEIMLLWYLDLR